MDTFLLVISMMFEQCQRDDHACWFTVINDSTMEVRIEHYHDYPKNCKVGEKIDQPIEQEWHIIGQDWKPYKFNFIHIHPEDEGG